MILFFFIKERDSLGLADSIKFPEEINELSSREKKEYFEQNAKEKENVYLKDYQDYRQKWKDLNSKFVNSFDEINLKDNEYVLFIIEYLYFITLKD